MRKKNRNNNGVNPQYIPQEAAPTRQTVASPIPQAENAGNTYQLPNTGNYAVVGSGMQFGLPQFTMEDKYGRVFSPIMSYGPQPNSAPVPIATPSKIVQLAPIVSPVAFVPYSTQNQPLYQYDEDND